LRHTDSLLGSEHAKRVSKLNKGTTQQLSMRKIVARLRKRVLLLESHKIPVYIILHDYRNDSNCLRDVFRLPASWLNLYDPAASRLEQGAICLLDTQKLFAHVFKLGTKQVSLGNCCAALGITATNLHNASTRNPFHVVGCSVAHACTANDATYTAEVFFALVQKSEDEFGPILADSPKKPIKRRVIDLDPDPPIDVDADEAPALPTRHCSTASTSAPPVSLDISDDEVERPPAKRRKVVVIDID
jgi:hypothetical protein